MFTFILLKYFLKSAANIPQNMFYFQRLRESFKLHITYTKNVPEGLIIHFVRAKSIITSI